MALSVNSTNLVDLGAMAIDGYPFTLTGWFRVPASSERLTLIQVSNTSTGSYHELRYEGHIANQAAAMTKTSSTSVARSAIPMTTNQWHHVAGIFESSTSRSVYLDGGNIGNAPHYRIFDGVDTFAFGNSISSTSIDAAEVAVLDIALGVDDIRALAAGISPLVISQLQNVLCYHDCIRRVNRPGRGPTATSAGAEVVVEHPRQTFSQGGRSLLQPCRFAGPYAIEKHALQTDSAAQSQVFLSGIQANRGVASAA